MHKCFQQKAHAKTVEEEEVNQIISHVDLNSKQRETTNETCLLF